MERKKKFTDDEQSTQKKKKAAEKGADEAEKAAEDCGENCDGSCGGECEDAEKDEIRMLLDAVAENWKIKFEKLADIAEEKYEALEKEYANFRKRTSETAGASKAQGEMDVLLELIPVLDNLDRAKQYITDPSNLAGFNLMEKQILSVLEKFGVTEIEALYAEFDMNLMNAVDREKNEQMAGLVTEVILKGYKRGDKVLRHAMVKIAY